MAMKHSRYVIFVGALSALALMTVLSAAFGFLLPNLLSRVYTHWASVILFAYFGGKLLKEGAEMEGGTLPHSPASPCLPRSVGGICSSAILLRVQSSGNRAGAETVPHKYRDPLSCA
jgi:putative Ca2+/H+ antiporter (TMEM165/GDT1 family)